MGPLWPGTHLFAFLCLWMGWEVLRVAGLSRAREHCSQAGGAEVHMQMPRPLPLLVSDIVQPDPSGRCQRVQHWLLPSVREGADPPLDWVWGSGPRQPSWAARERGCDCSRCPRACPQSTPACQQAPVAGFTGGWERGTQWHAGQPYDEGRALTWAGLGPRVGELTTVGKYQG